MIGERSSSASPFSTPSFWRATLLGSLLLGGCAIDPQSRWEQTLREGASALSASAQALGTMAKSALGHSPAAVDAQAPSTVGRFGLRLRTSDRVLHLQGLFELRADAAAASVNLFDPAGQPLLFWRQNAGEAVLIDAAGSGPLNLDQAERWLRQSGLPSLTPALNAWQWRRWLDLPEGRYEQGEFLIERTSERLRIVSLEGDALRLTLVPSELR